MLHNDTLFQRLNIAKRDELDEILTDLKVDPKTYQRSPDREVVIEISKLLRRAAGHSAMNLGRDAHKLPYKRILIDVADKLAPGFGWTSFSLDGPETEEQIEDYIDERVRARMREYFTKLPPNERAAVQRKVEEDLRKRGVPQHVIESTTALLLSGGVVAGLLGPVVTAAIFGSIWTWFVGFSLWQSLLGGALVGGPVGITMAGLSVAAGPSYSKVIPAVVRLIYVRRSRKAEGDFGSR